MSEVKNKTNLFGSVKTDLGAGLVVFLVALPLCLGIALASNVPLFSGLIAGIIGGIVIGLASGSHLSVSGPAAGLTAVVVVAIQKLGGQFDTFLLAVVFAGLFQIVFGLLRGGAITKYFPNSVITGMLTAIGIIIILKQLPHAVGYDKDAEGDFDFIQADGDNTFSALLRPFERLENTSAGAIVIAIVSILILIAWERPKIKKILPNFIPGALVAVVASVVINEIFIRTSPYLLVEPKHLVSVPVADSFTSFVSFFKLPNFSQITNIEVYIQAFTIAVVASIETLLCIEATDKMDEQQRITPTNRELIAQGTGNVVSGLIGGLPITSVIVRSSANINAGGKTKIAAIAHGLLLLFSAALIPTLLNKIPLAALAAILLMTGYKLAKISVFKQMFAQGKMIFIPFIVTVIAVVFTDLLKGVALGMVVAYAMKWLLPAENAVEK